MACKQCDKEYKNQLEDDVCDSCNAEIYTRAKSLNLASKMISKFFNVEYDQQIIIHFDLVGFPCAIGEELVNDALKLQHLLKSVRVGEGYSGSDYPFVDMVLVGGADNKGILKDLLIIFKGLKKYTLPQSVNFITEK